jgi:hypothetical protein
VYTVRMKATENDRGDRIQAEIVAGFEGAQRLRAAFEMSDLARNLALARLRQSLPHHSERDLLKALLRLSLSPAELPTELR